MAEQGRIIRIREITEDLERRTLSKYAVCSADSRGRLRPEEPCSVRTAFQRDRDRIVHSKAFRRLKHKTQVFIIPEGDHFRDRLTHTLEVAQIARTIARALRLNEDLTEAIALGHDLGHTPFGHAGEEVLNEIHPGGFQHNKQSLRIVDILEQGKGLNLTAEVRDGIVNHTGPQLPFTLEGQVVRLADRIAYVNHDIDDAIRGGVLRQEQLPRQSIEVLGKTHAARIDTMVKDIVTESWEQPEIKMSPAVWQAMMELRQFLFDNVYIGSVAKKEEEKAKNLVRHLYEFFLKNPGELPGGGKGTDETPLEQLVCDYVAGMTDRFAILTYENLFLPLPWSLKE